MSIAIHCNSLFYNSSLSSFLLGTWAKKQYLYKINIYTSTALRCGVGSCRSYMIFNSFNGGGEGEGEWKRPMNTKILQLSTDSRYLRSVTLMRLINNARLTIFHHSFRCSIHTGPNITSSKQLSSLNNSLMGVLKSRNGEMTEWWKNCLKS